MLGFTISDLKKAMGPGLGLRKSKYLIEIPIPGADGRTLNMLIRSAGLPERNINTVSTYYKGRKYNMRAETDYPGTFEISIVDDSTMSIRKVFDKWMNQVDNSKPKNSGILGSSFEKIFDEVVAIGSAVTEIKNAINNPVGFFLGFLDPGNPKSPVPYQTDINIWQLSQNKERVYGYKLQNAFPSQVGIVTLDDGEENTMSEFSVTLTYSEFIPLEDKSILSQIGSALLGTSGNNALNAINNL